MDMAALIERISRIPPEVRTRVLYESLPWERRKDFGRKIMDPAVKPIRPDMAVCGPAFTVADSHMSYEMLDDVRKKGCVMVVQTSGCEGTFVGLFMRELAARVAAETRDQIAASLLAAQATATHSLAHRHPSGALYWE